MVKICIPLFALALTFTSLAWSQDDDHSVEVCSRKNPNVCAHIGHKQGFTTTSTSEFVFHASTPDHEKLSDLKIDLWMPAHGHGSAPVVIDEVALNKFKITEAYFVMIGNWIIRAHFTLAGDSYDLEIPVVIIN